MVVIAVTLSLVTANHFLVVFLTVYSWPGDFPSIQLYRLQPPSQKCTSLCRARVLVALRPVPEPQVPLRTHRSTWLHVTRQVAAPGQQRKRKARLAFHRGGGRRRGASWASPPFFLAQTPQFFSPPRHGPGAPTQSSGWRWRPIRGHPAIPPRPLLLF